MGALSCVRAPTHHKLNLKDAQPFFNPTVFIDCRDGQSPPDDGRWWWRAAVVSVSEF